MCVERILKVILGSIVLLSIGLNEALAQNCQPKNDFPTDKRCGGKKFRAKNKTDLLEYLQTYGEESGKWHKSWKHKKKKHGRGHGHKVTLKDLEIDFDITGEGLEVHTPCAIYFKRGRKVEVSGDVCLQGDRGVFGSKNHIKSTHTSILALQSKIDFSGQTSFESNGHVSLSAYKRVKLGHRSSVIANGLHFASQANVFIGERSQVQLSGDFLFFGDRFYLGSRAELRAQNIRIQANRTLAIHHKASLAALANLNLEAHRCKLKKTSHFSFATRSGNCFKRFNQPAVLGDNQLETTLEDTILNFNLNQATDSDGDQVSYHLVSISGGQIAGCLDDSSSTQCTFTPDLNSTTTVEIEYSVTDRIEPTPGVATITIDITAVNDAPLIGANQEFTVQEDNALAFDLNSAVDVDNSPVDFQYIIVQAPLNGVLTGCLDGGPSTACLYTPAANFSGTEVITYKVNDGELDSVNVAVLSITVTEVNDAPVASFIFSPQMPRAGQEALIVDANASFDLETNISAYTVDFGDGTVQTQTTPLFTHLYQAAGSYNVHLTVSDPLRCNYFCETKWN